MPFYGLQSAGTEKGTGVSFIGRRRRSMVRSSHSVFVNRAKRKSASIPRHREINASTKTPVPKELTALVTKVRS